MLLDVALALITEGMTLEQREKFEDTMRDQTARHDDPDQVDARRRYAAAHGEQ